MLTHFSSRSSRLRGFARQRAFTLIELLVVILIIGILIAVAAPTFLNQQGRAHDSAATQSLAVAHRNTASIVTSNEGTIPSAAALRDELDGSEPGMEFVVANGTQATDYQLGKVAVKTSPSDGSVTLMTPSRSGTAYCGEYDQSSGWTVTNSKTGLGTTCTLYVGVVDAPPVAQASTLVGLSSDYGICISKTDATLACWGYNLDSYPDVPTDMTGVDGVITSMSLGYGNSCYIFDGGNLKCRGDNSGGALGDGTTNPSLGALVQVQGIDNAVRIGVSANSSCAVLEDHSVKCWGGGTLTPEVVPGVSALDISGTCAVLVDTTVACWSMASPDPVVVPGISGASSISGTCAVLTDKTVKCWGAIPYNEEGDTDQPATTVPGLTDVTQLAAGSNHVCALQTVGTVKCFGLEGMGELGDGGSSYSVAVTPVAVSGIGNAKSISSGGQASCAVLQDERVTCWGAGFAASVPPGNTPQEVQ